MDHQTVVTLRDLQELQITRQESDIVHAGKAPVDADKLDARIAELRAAVDADALARFNRLSRSGLAVVDVVEGKCRGCNISIPRGDLNRIRKGLLEPLCPHCGKFVTVVS